MKFALTVNSSHDAMTNDPEGEIVAILEDVITWLRGGSVDNLGGLVLRDSNGNEVGSVKVSQGRYRKNPGLIIWPNPPDKGQDDVVYFDLLQSERAFELAYQHVTDGKDYKHDFSKGVSIWTVLRGDRGSVRNQTRDVLLTRPDGASLWNDF